MVEVKADNVDVLLLLLLLLPPAELDDDDEKDVDLNVDPKEVLLLVLTGGVSW